MIGVLLTSLLLKKLNKTIDVFFVVWKGVVDKKINAIFRVIKSYDFFEELLNKRRFLFNKYCKYNFRCFFKFCKKNVKNIMGAPVNRAAYVYIVFFP